ncbi:hypothetical protein [Amaricoccus sp.]|uniref:hypothetical protein n=1 Tax=Amaricoccus sp. TaxID=1872485 RepID=UPI002B8B0575|nr:hypothetical protein [Amaricoccus sp.]HMR62029.1 hypothetical protein [Amaricoccus sp.]
MPLPRTALDRYLRLEATGFWREAPGAQPREVIVSFGRTTLLLSDLEERPLAHWALAGTQAIGSRDGATIFATGPETGETLAIRDRDMIEAIAAVSRAAERARPRAAPPRPRPVLGPLLALAALVMLVLYGPGLIRDQARRMVPPELAEEIGEHMLIGLMEQGGELCAAPEGHRALGRIAERLAPAPGPRIAVLDLGDAPAAALPGDLLLIGRGTIAEAPSPEVIAGWIALAAGRAPLDTLMRRAGLFGDLAFVVTGRLGEAALGRAAAEALRPPAPEEVAAAMRRLQDAGIDPLPFGVAAGGIDSAALPPPGAGAEPLLDAGGWAAVKGICG